ncbi:MAG: class I SAM-dependent methyltransferase [bacterium]|nr:class I SAM-dependent methyltransferase [bacterium]
MNETNEWLFFYGRPLTLKRYLWRIANHLEFLHNVIQCKPKKAVEIGIGTAAHSFLVSYFVPFVVAVDNDLSIIKFAKTSNKHFGRPIRFVVADAFNLPFKNSSTDLFFSQGFFEHFNEKEVNELVREQVRIADSTIFSVPSLYYGRKDIDNEWLLKKREWLKLLKPMRGKNIVKAWYSITGVRLITILTIRNFSPFPPEIIVFARRKKYVA